MASLQVIVGQTVIYTIWRERNIRIFIDIWIPTEVFFKIIDRETHNTCSAKKHIPKFKDYLVLWF